jgi:hypothetical protein
MMLVVCHEVFDVIPELRSVCRVCVQPTGGNDLLCLVCAHSANTLSRDLAIPSSCAYRPDEGTDQGVSCLLGVDPCQNVPTVTGYIWGKEYDGRKSLND